MLIKSHRDLEVYKSGYALAMDLFEATKTFPKDEQYALVAQVRKSSRSVCANLAEAWKRRRYEAAFINKLNEVEAECAETQVWAEFARDCGYLTATAVAEFIDRYESLLRSLAGMIKHSSEWTLRKD